MNLLRTLNNKMAIRAEQMSPSTNTRLDVCSLNLV